MYFAGNRLGFAVQQGRNATCFWYNVGYNPGTVTSALAEQGGRGIFTGFYQICPSAVLPGDAIPARAAAAILTIYPRSGVRSPSLTHTSLIGGKVRIAFQLISDDGRPFGSDDPLPSKNQKVGALLTLARPPTTLLARPRPMRAESE